MGAAIPSCIMWTIWRKHNERTFEGIEHSFIKNKNKKGLNIHLRFKTEFYALCMIGWLI